MNDLPKPRHKWFAALYDRLDRLGEARTTALRKRLLAGVGGTVLEVGCGTGQELRALRLGTNRDAGGDGAGPIHAGEGEGEA